MLLTLLTQLMWFIFFRFRPDFATAWMNLAIVQAAQQQYSTAEQSYITALTYRRRYPDCLYNLGNLVLHVHHFALSHVVVQYLIFNLAVNCVLFFVLMKFVDFTCVQRHATVMSLDLDCIHVTYHN